MRMHTIVVLAAFALVSDIAAADGVPDPTVHQIPIALDLVGQLGGTPDPAGSFRVVVRDLALNPIPDAPVGLDFGNCSGFAFCANQPDPAVVVDCTGRRLTKYSNAQGIADFDVLGFASTPSYGGENAGGCLRVYVGSELVRFVILTAADHSGDGLNIADVSSAFRDFGSGTHPSRSDYDHNGFVNIVDLSLLLRRLGDGRSSETCVPAATCP